MKTDAVLSRFESGRWPDQARPGKGGGARLGGERAPRGAGVWRVARGPA
jgi:hypothetical protein